jgi:hypothetical protein
MLSSLLTEEGRKRAKWILKRVGLIDEDTEEDELMPKVESENLEDYEIDLFDEVEYALAFDYEFGYNKAMRAIDLLVRRKRFKSALYICDMIGDEIVRRSVLMEGMMYYERIGDFEKAGEFARLLGDMERFRIYKRLSELFAKIKKSRQIYHDVERSGSC